MTDTTIPTGRTARAVFAAGFLAAAGWVAAVPNSIDYLLFAPLIAVFVAGAADAALARRRAST